MAKGLFLREHKKDYNCILFYSMYWQGRYEGLHENQQSVNDCVSTISDMGKMAMKVSFSKSNSYICCVLLMHKSHM